MQRLHEMLVTARVEQTAGPVAPVAVQLSVSGLPAGDGAGKAGIAAAVPASSASDAGAKRLPNGTAVTPPHQVQVPQQQQQQQQQPASGQGSGGEVRTPASSKTGSGGAAAAGGKAAPQQGGAGGFGSLFSKRCKARDSTGTATEISPVADNLPVRRAVPSAAVAPPQGDEAA